MVALVSLIAFFVVVAIVVVSAAVAGSRRRRDRQPPSRGADRALYTGLAIVIVGIGLGVPLLLLIDNAADADRNTVGGVDLTAAQADGRQLFAENCGTCHTLAASGSTGAIGPDLDVLRPQAALVENAILVGRAAGRGNMPAGLLSGDDAKDVASFVEAVAGHADVSAVPPAPATTSEQPAP